MPNQEFESFLRVGGGRAWLESHDTGMPPNSKHKKTTQSIRLSRFGGGVD